MVNIVGKEKNTSYKHILNFPRFFFRRIRSLNTTEEINYPIAFNLKNKTKQKNRLNTPCGLWIIIINWGGGGRAGYCTCSNTADNFGKQCGKIEKNRS